MAIWVRSPRRTPTSPPDVEDEEFQGDQAQVSRWRWTVVPLHALTFAANTADALSECFRSLAQDVAGHYNYQSRRDFAVEAHQELERLSGGDIDG